MKSPINKITQITHLIRRHWKTILLCTFISLATLVLSTIISIWLNRFHNLRMASFGTIRAIGVEVYGGDLNETQINWGIVYPGILTNRSFYIKSKSNIPVTLIIKQSNVTLLNSDGENVTSYLPLPTTEALYLTWNYSGIVLNPEQVIHIIFTLSVSDSPNFLEFLVHNNIVEFSFDICIEARPAE